MDYLRDPSAIYAKSFAIIAAEAEIGHLPEDARNVAVRVIHACGMTEIGADILISRDFVTAATACLRARKPIITDSEMVKRGIIRLPPGVETICTLNDERVHDIARARQTTRAGAAVELWESHLAGALVAIGNAPTALFALLEKLDAGSARPAAIVAFPVGFVGATEAKRELANETRSIPFATLPGRRGGSAMAAAVVNALVEEVTV